MYRFTNNRVLFDEPMSQCQKQKKNVNIFQMYEIPLTLFKVVWQDLINMRNL